MSQPDIQLELDQQRKRASSLTAAGSANLVSPGGQGSSKKQRTLQDKAPEFDVVMELLKLDKGRIVEHNKLQTKGFFRYCGDYNIKPILFTDLARIGFNPFQKSIPISRNPLSPI